MEGGAIKNYHKLPQKLPQKLQNGRINTRFKIRLISSASSKISGNIEMNEESTMIMFVLNVFLTSIGDWSGNIANIGNLGNWKCAEKRASSGSKGHLNQLYINARDILQQ